MFSRFIHVSVLDFSDPQQGSFQPSLSLVISAKLAGLQPKCCSHEATYFLLIAYHQNLLFFFERVLWLELPHTLFQIKSVLLDIAWELSVLMGYLYPWAESLNQCFGCWAMTVASDLLAPLFRHATSALQVSWGKAVRVIDGAPALPAYCAWCRPSALWVGADWRKGAPQLLAVLTRNFNPLTVCQGWWGMLAASFPNEILYSLVGSWGKRESSLLGDSCLECSFSQGEQGDGGKSVGYDSYAVDSHLYYWILADFLE